MLGGCNGIIRENIYVYERRSQMLKNRRFLTKLLVVSVSINIIGFFIADFYLYKKRWLMYSYRAGCGILD
jgi:energy-converting hydrogenase Eha subunit G